MAIRTEDDGIPIGLDETATTAKAKNSNLPAIFVARLQHIVVVSWQW